MEKERKRSEWQAGFRPNRTCVGHVYTSSTVTKGRKDAVLATCRFFLYIQKACDTIWRNGLRKKVWEIGTREEVWRMMKNIRECSRSTAIPDGEISKYVGILQRGAHGRTRPSSLFKIFVKRLDSVVAAEAAKPGVTVSYYTVSGSMFADGIVGISETPKGL